MSPFFWVSKPVVAESAYTIWSVVMGGLDFDGVEVCCDVRLEMAGPRPLAGRILTFPPKGGWGSEVFVSA